LSHVRILCNNNARKLAENPVFHCRTKHIDVRHHFMKEVLKGGDLSVKFTPTSEMAADVLTKSLSKPKHLRCLEILGIPIGEKKSGLINKNPQIEREC